jgi:hypothetical protein
VKMLVIWWIGRHSRVNLCATLKLVCHPEQHLLP